MLPLQCPMNVSLSHLSDQIPRAESAAVAIVGDALGEALRHISNQMPDWMFHSANALDLDEAADGASGISNVLSGAVVAGVALGVGAFKVWQYTRSVQRMLQRRAELAGDQPARIQQRRNAIDERPVSSGIQPIDEGLPQASSLSGRQQQDLIAIGYQVGYFDADSQNSGSPTERPPFLHENLAYIEQQYEGAALSEALSCFAAGRRVGAEAASIVSQSTSDRPSGLRD